MTAIPAAERTLDVLSALAAAPGPVAATALARQLGMPRSSTYQLLAVLAGRGFVVHLPESGRWGLGVAAFEVGAAYLRHDPLERLAAPLLRRLVSGAQRTAPVVGQLGVLHGADLLYLLKEDGTRSVPVVTDVGVRLPAVLTASGRALLARLPTAHLRAQLGGRGVFVDRTGRGPRTFPELARLLTAERAQGHSAEDGFITPGIASVAAAAADHVGHPIAAFALTFRSEHVPPEVRVELAAGTRRAAAALTRRLGGTPS